MTPARPSLLLFVLPAAALSIAAAGPAFADDPAGAERQFDRGMAAWKAGKVEEGCKLIGESQRLDPRPGTLFTLATCEAEAGQAATAWARFGEYLALYDRLPPDVQRRQGDRPKVARTQRDKLAAEAAELTLALAPGAPSGTVVKRNGVVMSEASLGVSLPVDAGEYVITTEAPGGPVREERVRVAAGEKKTLTLSVATAAPPPPPPPPRPEAKPGPSARRVIAFGAGGVGVAGLVMGAITGGIVLSRKNTIEAHCGSAVNSSDPYGCDAKGVAAASGLSGLGTASTVGFVLGIAGIGAGLGLFLSEPKDPATATAHRRWISVGLRTAGPSGAAVGAEGGF